MEQYKVIPEYPRYSISNKGNVINNKTGRAISQRMTTNGYMRFNVRKGDVPYEKPRVLMTHRVVADLFLPKVEGKTYVNHKDANKTNNDVNNLEWCTAQENSQHACKTIEGLRDTYMHNLSKAQEANKLRIVVHKGGAYIGAYDSKQEAAKALGLHEKTIYNGLHGMSNRHGYTFAIDEEVVVNA